MINYNQNGRSMIEMLGVLAIIGVLSVGGIAAYSKAMSTHKTNTILNGLTHTINNVRTLFLQQDDIRELDTKLANQTGVIPDEFKAEGSDLSKIVHAYGGNIEVHATTVGDKVYYAVEINGLPKEAALEIATKNWSDDGDLVAVNLNDGSNEPTNDDNNGGD